MNTPIQDVIDSFESSFQDKRIIPYELELVWLKKAVAKYSIELEDLPFNYDTCEFEGAISQYAIDTVAQIMKILYQEREVSKVNKRVSIVSKELSVDGNGNSKKAAREELVMDIEKMNYMLNNQMPTAYN